MVRYDPCVCVCVCKQEVRACVRTSGKRAIDINRVVCDHLQWKSINATITSQSPHTSSTITGTVLACTAITSMPFSSSSSLVFSPSIWFAMINVRTQILWGHNLIITKYKWFNDHRHRRYCRRWHNANGYSLFSRSLLSARDASVVWNLSFYIPSLSSYLM